MKVWKMEYSMCQKGVLTNIIMHLVGTLWVQY